MWRIRLCKYSIMKNLYRIIALSVFALLSYTVQAATFEIIKPGKYTDNTIWREGIYPGTTIGNNDVVIVNSHIVINSDIEIEGILIVEKTYTVISNKSLFVTSTGRVVNSGSINVKTVMNEGQIDNYSQLETTGDLQNRGIINNNVNMVTGTDFINQSSNVGGNNGTYFVNGSMVTSPNTKIENSVKILVAEQQVVSSNSSMTLEANVIEKNVMLTVNNPKVENVSKFEVERSFDGQQYNKIYETGASVSATYYLYQDNNVNNETVYYKVKVVTGSQETYLPSTVVKVANENKASIR